VEQSNAKVVVWEQDELALLIKAANIYPAGSVERWTQVAKYINDHSKNGSTAPKNEKDVIREVSNSILLTFNLSILGQENQVQRGGHCSFIRQLVCRPEAYEQC
jgi:hypothetical protein